MTKQELYWAEREKAFLLEEMMEADELAGLVQAANTKTYLENQEQLYAWYAKYGDANGISITEAQKLAEEIDVKTLAKRAKEFVANKDLSPEANAAMRDYNFAMKTSRLELLNNQLRWANFEGSYTQDEIMKKVLSKKATRALERQAGIMGKTLYSPTETRRLAEYITKTSYKGNTFSERIWGQGQDNMKRDLDDTLRRGILQGKNPAAQANALARIHQTKQSDAERLLRTEGARVAAHARAASFERAGYTHFKWVPRGNPCKHCLEKVQQSAAEPFELKGAEARGDMPPLHPYCYCATAPVEPDENIPTKAQIDAEFEAKWQKALDGDKNSRKYFEDLYGSTQTANWKQFKLEDAAEGYKERRAAALAAQKAAEEAAAASRSGVEGRNLVGQPYIAREGEQGINAVIREQGFDGKPRLVSRAEFNKAKKESGFYAQRTYASDSYDTLKEYRRQLYDGEFYVDCGTGGAQYGQGMYCASTYDLKNASQLRGIQNEMEHYIELGKERGFRYNFVEDITIHPSAKVYEIPEWDVADRAVRRDHSIRYFEEHASTAAEKKLLANYKASLEKYSEEITEYHRLSQTKYGYPKRPSRRKLDNAEFKLLESPMGEEYSKTRKVLTAEGPTTYKDVGVLAAEMGYDVIRAEGHGESGSYSVILNRTKLIMIKKE